MFKLTHGVVILEGHLIIPLTDALGNVLSINGFKAAEVRQHGLAVGDLTGGLLVEVALHGWLSRFELRVGLVSIGLVAGVAHNGRYHLLFYF